MKVFVGGINGTGKTTICDLVAHELGIKHIKGSALLMDYLGYPGDYEKLRALTAEQQEKTLKECIEALLSNKDSFLLDAHYLSLHNGKINARTGDWINKFDALVLMTAPIEDVLGRIERDVTKRDRALFSKNPEENDIKNLEDFQKVTREEFLKVLAVSKKPGIEVINEEGRQEATISGFVEFLRGFNTY